MVSNNSSYNCIQENDSNKNCLRVFNEDVNKCAVCNVNYFWTNAHCEKSPAYFVEPLPGQVSESTQSTHKTVLQTLLDWLFGN